MNKYNLWHEKNGTWILQSTCKRNLPKIPDLFWWLFIGSGASHLFRGRRESLLHIKIQHYWDNLGQVCLEDVVVSAIMCYMANSKMHRVTNLCKALLDSCSPRIWHSVMGECPVVSLLEDTIKCKGLHCHTTTHARFLPTCKHPSPPPRVVLVYCPVLTTGPWSKAGRSQRLAPPWSSMVFLQRRNRPKMELPLESSW